MQHRSTAKQWPLTFGSTWCPSVVQSLGPGSACFAQTTPLLLGRVLVLVPVWEDEWVLVRDLAAVAHTANRFRLAATLSLQRLLFVFSKSSSFDWTVPFFL